MNIHLNHHGAHWHWQKQKLSKFLFLMSPFIALGSALLMALIVALVMG